MSSSGLLEFVLIKRDTKDFDGDQVGQFVTQELSPRSSRIVHWNIMPASNFPNGTADVLTALIKDEQAWIVVTSES